jgi:exonuclease VII small subunit
LDTALSNWEDIIAPIAAADKTLAPSELTLQEIYHKYVGVEARDISV